MFAVEIRCHVVTFNFTTRDPDLLERLGQALENDVQNKSSRFAPECVRDYAVADNIIHRVEPVDAGSKNAAIPVRIIVGKDGTVNDVHVIRASAGQRRNIEEALRQWRFKPYLSQGHPVDVETGLMVRM